MANLFSEIPSRNERVIIGLFAAFATGMWLQKYLSAIFAFPLAAIAVVLFHIILGMLFKSNAGES